MTSVTSISGVLRVMQQQHQQLTPGQWVKAFVQVGGWIALSGVKDCVLEQQSP